jgi:hypothetical protein
VAGCCEYGEGHSGSGATELVIIHTTRPLSSYLRYRPAANKFSWAPISV